MARSNSRRIADLLSGSTNDELQAKEEIVFEGATDNAFETKFQVVDPTADRTITFPDDSGTIALTKNYTTNTDFQSTLANTNLYIASTQSNIDTENARIDLINTNLTATNTAIRSLVTTESGRIDSLNTNLTSTNTTIRTLVSDRMQVANVTSTYATISRVSSNLANTNARLVTLELESGVEGGGFVLGTLTEFPGTDGDVDYLEGGTSDETYVGSTGESGSDAFGVSLQSVYDNMDPIGRIVTEDLGTL